MTRPLVTISPDIITVDTSRPEGRLLLADAFHQRMFDREVGWALERVGGRLERHRGIQARERQGLPLDGYYRSSAHSRAEVVEAVKQARARRDDFLRRWPAPVPAPFAGERRVG